MSFLPKKLPLYQHASHTSIFHVHFEQGSPNVSIYCTYEWMRLDCNVSSERHRERKKRNVLFWRATRWQHLELVLMVLDMFQVCGPYSHVAKFQEVWMKAHWDIWRRNPEFPFSSKLRSSPLTYFEVNVEKIEKVIFGPSWAYVYHGKKFGWKVSLWGHVNW